MHRRTRTRFALIAGLLVAAMLGMYACSEMGAFIVVKNSSNLTIADVVLEARGARREIGKLSPGHARLVRLAPLGESDLAVSFTAGGRRIEHAPSGYFENSWLYVVSVEITRDLGVDVRGRIP